MVAELQQAGLADEGEGGPGEGGPREILGGADLFADDAFFGKLTGAYIAIGGLGGGGRQGGGRGGGRDGQLPRSFA